MYLKRETRFGIGLQSSNNIKIIKALQILVFLKWIIFHLCLRTNRSETSSQLSPGPQWALVPRDYCLNVTKKEEVTGNMKITMKKKVYSGKRNLG